MKRSTSAFGNLVSARPGGGCMVSPDSAPVKRLVRNTGAGMLIDAS